MEPSKHKKLNEQNREHPMLSKREKEVIKLVAEGHRSKNIANRLNISVHTVHTHRKNITGKINAKSLGELIRFAVANGLL